MNIRYIIVDDDNYRLSNPCDTEDEARAQAASEIKASYVNG